MLSFVWGKAGSTIKSRGRIFTSATLKCIRTHARRKPASFGCRAHRPAGGKAGGIHRV
jgi:hypothetical protein